MPRAAPVTAGELAELPPAPYVPLRTRPLDLEFALLAAAQHRIDPMG